MVVCTFNPSTQKVEASRSLYELKASLIYTGLSGQQELQGETLPVLKKKKKKGSEAAEGTAV